MVTFLKKVFNIRQNEILVFGLFFFFYFLIGIQFSIGLTVSEALFLSEVGPGFLPYMYIFNALMIIFVSGIYSSLTEKLSVPAMFKATLIFFILLVGGVRTLIAADIRALAMPIAFPLLHTLFVMFTNMIPNNFRAFYGMYLDVLQSKRLVPIILTGGRYGGIVGGLAIPLLIPVFGSVANLLYIWVGAIVLSVGFVQFVETALREHMIDDEGVRRKRSGRKKGGKGGGNLSMLKTNRYIAAFAIFSFLVVILRSFQDFQYSVIFREVFPERAALASFLGYFTAIGSAISLLIQTFITPRLIRRLGMGTANLLYPLTTIAGFIAMAIAPGFSSAIFLRFNNKNLQESIRNAINALLYNAVPPSVRGRVGAFIAGQVVAVASIVSGIALLVIKPTGLALFPLTPRWLAIISLFIGVAYLVGGFFLRREYGAALRRMLEERNLGLFRYVQEGFGALDHESLNILIHNLHEGDDDLCVFAAQMLADSKAPEALDAIIEEIQKRKRKTANNLIQILASAPGARESESVQRIWRDALSSDDPARRCAAMDAIEKTGLTDDLVERVQENLQHPSPEVKAQAVRLLVHSDDLFWLASGLQTLHAMLAEGTPGERICALRCIGELENPRFIRRLIPHLRDPDPHVREAALESVESLGRGPGTNEEEIDEVIRAALADTVPAIRRRGIRLLARRGTRVNFVRLLAALSDAEEIVRREAVQSLKKLKRHGTLSLEGRGLLRFLSPRLFQPANGTSQEMSAEEIVVGLTDFSLDHLLEVYEIVNHLSTIEQQEDAKSLIILHKALSDKVHERTWLILELLGVISDEKTVDTVSETLARSATSSARAIALETLSNVNAVGSTRQLILMLEPLLLAGTSTEKVAEGRKTWDLPPVALEDVFRVHMDSNDPWIRAIAADAAGRHYGRLRDTLPANVRETWEGQFKALARDEDAYVREAAVAALGIVSTALNGARPFLQSAVQDADVRVQNQARRALARLEALSGDGNPGNRPTGEVEMLSTIEKALFLKGIKMFESMSADQLKILSNISKEIRVPEGKVLFEEGDPCDYLYVIVDGEIEIVKNPGSDQKILLAVLGPTTSFGEIALFGDEGRTAAARASTDATLLGIEKDPLLLLIHEHPTISIAIIAQLAQIIRHQNETQAAAESNLAES